MANTGKAPAHHASEALLPQKGFHATEKESQLGSVPARKCSLLLKKMQLTSLGLGAASHWGGKLRICPDPGLSDARSSVRRILSSRWRPPFLWPSRYHPGLAHREYVNPSTEGLSLAATVDKT